MEARAKNIIYILKTLQSYSDEETPLSQVKIAGIIKDKYGVNIDRHAISQNIKALMELGYDVKTTSKGCYINHLFTKEQANILTLAIFSSNTIPTQSAEEITDKISSLLSKKQSKSLEYAHNADKINRSENNEFLKNVRILSSAIKNKTKITFQYTRYDTNGNPVPKENPDGRLRKVSPYEIVHYNGKQYLVCCEEKKRIICSYKITKMVSIKETTEPIIPMEEFDEFKNGFNVASYINKHLYMFNGQLTESDIILELKNAYDSDTIFEWFGKTASVYTKDNKTYYANVGKLPKLAIVCWALQYYNSVEVKGPKEIRNELKLAVKTLIEKYNAN